MHTRKFFVLLACSLILAISLPTQTISSVSSAPVSEVIEFIEHTIDSDFENAQIAYASDLDGDQDMDVFGANYNQVAWWENDGKETFTRHIISTGLNGVQSMHSADLDGDKDLDILAAIYWDTGILWWENDGTGKFTEHWVDENFNYAFSVFAIDLDDDGDVDVLGASMDSSDVIWWENDGKESFTKHLIDADYQSASAVYGVDLDDDKDIDIVAGALDDYVAWFENDGNENLTRADISDWSSDFEPIHQVLPLDLDSDGDIDVLGVEWDGSSIAWWENDGSESFAEHSISAAVEAVYASDLDRDGDMDVQGAGSYAAWWQNDGSQNFSKHTIDSGEATSIYTSDVDGDGDLDLLTAGGAITWWEQVGYELVFLPLALSVDEPPSSAPVIDAIPNSDGDGNYTVSWSTVERASSYTLDEDSDAAFSSPRVAYSGPDTSESLTGKGLGTYYYRVRAFGGLGSSDWSETESVDVTVKPTPVPGPDEGAWSGSNINFTVSGDSVYNLTIKYLVVCPTGIMVKTKTFDETADITNDNFEFDADGDPTVEGHFTSNSHASGTWSSSFFFFGIGTCQGSGTWSADGP